MAVAQAQGEAVRAWRRRARWRVGGSQVATYVGLTLLAAFMALPLVFMVNQAFKPAEELFLFPPRFFVRHPTTRNFHDLLVATNTMLVPFTRYVFNSIVVAGASVAFTVLSASLAAYAIAKHRAPGSGALFTLVVSALMFAPQVTQIPRYMIVNGLGLVDTYWALILPALAVPYGLFFMKQFIEPLPDALLEAARMDGATEWQMFWRVVMPMARPAWATLTAVTFIGTWNDFFTPLIFTQSEVMKTLPLALVTIYGGPGQVARAGAAQAATFLMTVPTVVVFVLLQRKVIETMAYSGIKS